MKDRAAAAAPEPSNWRQKFVAADGTVYYDDDCAAAILADAERKQAAYDAMPAEVREANAAATVEHEAMLDTDPVIRAERAKGYGDIAPRADQLRTEVFARHGLTIRRRLARPPVRRKTAPAAAPRRASARARGAGRPKAAASRSSARSGDSGSDSDSDGPGQAGPRRVCACGCGRDISHKRANARTYNGVCRNRLSRASARDPERTLYALRDARAADVARVHQAILDGRIKPHTGFRLMQLVAVGFCGSDDHGREFDLHDALMRANGSWAPVRRRLPREWRTAHRGEVVA